MVPFYNAGIEKAHRYYLRSLKELRAELRFPNIFKSDTPFHFIIRTLKHVVTRKLTSSVFGGLLCFQTVLYNKSIEIHIKKPFKVRHQQNGVVLGTKVCFFSNQYIAHA